MEIHQPHISRTGRGVDFELSREDYNELNLRCAFDLFDKNSDGKLNISELANVLRAVGQNPTTQELEEIIKSVDDNHDEMLSFEEYENLLRNHLKDPQVVRIELEQAFHMFDRDRNGTLDRRELRAALMGCGKDPMTAKEVEELFAMIDKDGSQTIDVMARYDVLAFNKRCQEPMSAKEVEDLFGMIDKDRSQTSDVMEFVNYMCTPAPPEHAHKPQRQLHHQRMVDC